MNALEEIFEFVSSDCCGAEVFSEDICAACGEHCEVIVEESTIY